MRYQRFMMSMVACMMLLGGGTALQANPEPVQTRVAMLLDTLASYPDVTIAGETIHALPLVGAFYGPRGCRPAWSDGEKLLLQADDLIQALAAADAEGLNPADYHLVAIRRLVTALQQPRPVHKNNNTPDKIRYVPPAAELLARLELLFTDAFITYGSHLAGGRVDPEKIFTHWQLYPADVDPLELLRQALTERGVRESLRDLLPVKNGYFHLHEALARYREIESKGGWPVIATGPKLFEGDRDERVAMVRHRLKMVGDLAADDTGGDLYDAPLAAAVRHYQQRMGLLVDGVIGRRTVAAMNVPVSRRIRQIILNMERLRWLPRELGQRYLQVNIAAFSLRVVENDKPVLDMRAIVGKRFNNTPVFSKMMEYLVINPYWWVPKRIFIEELAPRLRDDPGLLARKHMRIKSEWGDNGDEIDPATIDWAKVDAENFPYYVRQDSGPFNELGVIKFMFPNKYRVYLHDTRSKYLFDASVRTFSHGCVRIEKPLALAEYLLRDDPDWDKARIREAIDSGERQLVNLKQQLPVYFLYLTAWVDDEGLHFRDDIYHRDSALAAAFL